MANPSNTTKASAWSTKRGTELELPSGNTCLAQRPGMEKVLSSGVIPDDMAEIALKQIAKVEKGIPSDHQAKGPDQVSREQLAEIIKTPADIYRMMDAFDRICVQVVMEPKVIWHKTEMTNPETGRPVLDDKGFRTYEELSEDQRRKKVSDMGLDYDDVLWTDQVDLEDKVFMFNWAVGGSADLARFRQEYGDGVDAVSAGKDMDVSPE